MSYTTFKALVFFAALAAFVVTPASATLYGTVDITSHNQNYSSSAYLYSPALDGGTGGDFYTGVYSWTTGATTGLGAYVPNWGFCIELSQEAATGVENVTDLSDAPVPPEYGYSNMGDTKANYIRELWGRDFNPAWSTGGDLQGAQAFSAAIWEIIYETDPRPWDVTSGTGFYASLDAATASIANSWLSQLNGNPAYFANNLVAISSPTGQDYVVQIPEPATLSLLAVGTAALLRRRRS